MSGNRKNIDFELLAKYISGEIGGAGQTSEALNKPIDEDSDSEWGQEMKNAKAIWDASLKVKPAKEYDVDGAWKNVSMRIKSGQATTTKTVRFPVSRWLYMAASVVLVGVVYFFIQNILKKGDGTLPLARQWNSAGEVIVDTLSDGTIFTLNKFSSLKLDNSFFETSRNVTLKGEAFFEVAKNKSLPFIIDTHLAKIEVVGTKFTVNTISEDNVSVFVEEGRVKVQSKFNPETEKVINKSTLAKVQRNEDRIEVAQVDELQGLNYWRTQTLVFSQEALKDVCQVLGEAYNTQVVVGPELENCQLTATFEGMKLQDVLEIISTTFNVTLNIQNNQYILEGEKCH